MYILYSMLDILLKFHLLLILDIHYIKRRLVVRIVHLSIIVILEHLLMAVFILLHMSGIMEVNSYLLLVVLVVFKDIQNAPYHLLMLFETISLHSLLLPVQVLVLSFNRCIGRLPFQFHVLKVMVLLLYVIVLLIVVLFQKDYLR